MIRKLVVSNYKSLGESVALELGQLTALVGLNGSGKSNLTDVLRFVRDCLESGLSAALKLRRGFRPLRRASSGRLHDVSIRVEIINETGNGFWEFSLGDDSAGSCRVLHESALWKDTSEASFRVAPGELRSVLSPELESVLRLTPWGDDFALHYLARVKESPFRTLVAELLNVSIYTIYPDNLREPEFQEDAALLPMEEHGGDWASSLQSLDRQTQGNEFLSGLAQITGDIDDYQVLEVGDYLVPRFHHRASDGPGYWLNASQESDGTLRAAGVLLALLQKHSIFLVGIEEPEQTLHPGALPVLYDFIRAASYERQVILTTHNPQLLDLLQIDEIRLVERSDHGTIVSLVDESQRTLVRNKLFSASYLWQAEGLRAESNGRSNG
jgi:predicted ATPase